MGFEDYRTKLIAIAERIALDGATDNKDFLRRFRTVYRHLVITVDGTAQDLGMGPYGPMPDMSSMRPDTTRLLSETESELDSI